MTDDAGTAGSDRSGTGEVVEHFAADEAFGLLGNEKRLDILGRLFEAEGPLSFSELREAVGIRDSGQFNYHLDKLLGTFVRQDGKEYELTSAGTHVVGAILAGEYTKTIEGDPVAVGADCQHCGGMLAGFFEGEGVRIACEDCDRNVLDMSMPPGALEDYPREEWPFLAERWTRQELETVRAGFCPACYGPIVERLTLDPDSVGDAFDASVEYSCQRCDRGITANATASVVSHPAVVSFHHEHGVDIEGTPVWDLEWPIQPNAAIVSRDPVRVEVSIQLDGDRLVLVLDETATVVEERREPAG